MIEDMNTAYPVRNLAERASSLAYFVDKEVPTNVLVMSNCHNSERTWEPERFSPLDIKRAVKELTYQRRVCTKKERDVDDGYVKPMMWTLKERQNLKIWREESSATAGRGGYRNAPGFGEVPS